MANSKTTIELNGKLYDARTGRIIGDATTPQATASPSSGSPRTASTNNTGMILDGFVRRKPAQPANVVVAQPKPPQPTTPPAQSRPVSVQAKQHQKTSHAQVNHAQRAPEKSQTLMRPAVKKPETIHHGVAKQPSRPAVKAPVNHARVARAEVTAKSPLVSRFGATLSGIEKKEAHLPVVAQSVEAMIGHGVSNELKKLEEALIDANAHLQELEQTAIKKLPLLRRVGFKNKTANLAAMSCAFLLLVGFFAYQNATAISVKMASREAGFSAALPSYKPAGFAVEKNVDAEPGKVTVSYKSRTDDKQYSLIQQSSNWNSTSLLANYVTKENCSTCYQTWQNDGKTIYVYDGSNATWVSGGVWYTVEGNAQLTSDQILKIASSL